MDLGSYVDGEAHGWARQLYGYFDPAPRPRDIIHTYYLRTESNYKCVAYPRRLAVDLGSYVDGEAYGWARQPYGYFDPAPRPRDIIHTYFLRRRPCLAHPVGG